MQATTQRANPRFRLGLWAVSACAAAVASTSAPSTASAQIKSPGAHPHYGVEVEPHLVLQWDGPWHYNDEGLGVGARFGVPVIESGPITTINNSMAIGFGLDWVHFEDSCWWEGHYPGWDGWDQECTANYIWLPVTLQWNFWFSDMFSLFGEPGLAIVRQSYEDWYRCNSLNGWCQYDESDWDFEPTLSIGGRLLFSDSAGLALRVGWPYASLGASLLF